MIIGIIGNIGSGKTISAIRLLRQRRQMSYVNFSCTLPNVHRLKVEDIVKQDLIEPESGRGKPKVKLALNWDFWKESLKKHGGYDIVLDEVHNLINSRRSMSSFNVRMMEWVSQVRKVLGSSEHHNIYMISQRTERIDISTKDLMHEVVYCEKFFIDAKGNWMPATEAAKRYAVKVMTRVFDGSRVRVKPVYDTRILQYHFIGPDCVRRLEHHLLGVPKLYKYRDWFRANDFMAFYNSYEIVEFGASEYL